MRGIAYLKGLGVGGTVLRGLRRPIGGPGSSGMRARPSMPPTGNEDKAVGAPPFCPRGGHSLEEGPETTPRATVH